MGDGIIFFVILPLLNISSWEISPSLIFVVVSFAIFELIRDKLRNMTSPCGIFKINCYQILINICSLKVKWQPRLIFTILSFLICMMYVIIYASAACNGFSRKLSQQELSAVQQRYFGRILRTYFRNSVFESSFEYQNNGEYHHKTGITVFAGQFYTSWWNQNFKKLLDVLVVRQQRKIATRFAYANRWRISIRAVGCYSYITIRHPI